MNEGLLIKYIKSETSNKQLFCASLFLLLLRMRRKQRKANLVCQKLLLLVIMDNLVSPSKANRKANRVLNKVCREWNIGKAVEASKVPDHLFKLIQICLFSTCCFATWA